MSEEQNGPPFWVRRRGRNLPRWEPIPPGLAYIPYQPRTDEERRLMDQKHMHAALAAARLDLIDNPPAEVRRIPFEEVMKVLRELFTQPSPDAPHIVEQPQPLPPATPAE